jgi:hypothetical protein
MLNYIKPYVPSSIKKQIKRIRYYLNNELPYVELHLTDHCNLNCKACSHYCPIAPPNYTNLIKYEADMTRLSQIFDNIHTIRLLGGEPLLHPDPTSFIIISRTSFPKSRIRFVTNGILLPKAPTSFWEACRKTNTTIDLTLYPPLQKNTLIWRKICEDEGVDLCMEEINTFHARMNINGDSVKEKSFNFCRSHYFCPFLKEGRIYSCFMAATIQHFNNNFGTRIIADPGVDIYLPKMSRQVIMKYLSKPIETCRWCSHNSEQFSWSVSKKKIQEWDSSTYRDPFP